MSAQMDELLAQAYGTHANIAALGGGQEKTAEAALLDELEKVAAAEGIDLSELSDSDIAEILAEAMGREGEGEEKTAGLDAGDMAKLAEADFIGRAMAHAFYSEMAAIQGGTEKTAADEEFLGQFEEAASLRAAEILGLAGAEGYEAYITDGGGAHEKTAASEELDEAVTERAAEILAENGYDVDQIFQILANS